VTLIVYINSGGNPDVRDNDLFEIDAAGFLVDMGSVLVDHCSHAASAASRPALQRAIRRLRPGDTLVIARLGYLGSSISDAVSTLTTLAARQAHAICLDAGKTDLCTSGDDSAIRMLQLAAELERDAKRARALDAAAIAKKVGTQQGRPASLSNSQRQQALKALAAGSTVTAIARVLSTLAADHHPAARRGIARSRRRAVTAFGTLRRGFRSRRRTGFGGFGVSGEGSMPGCCFRPL